MAGVHFLHNVSLFANLSASELEPLAQRLIARKYREGEPVIQQGSSGGSLYIVKSGLVEIVVTGPDGSEQALARFGPGQVFGEFALLDGLPRSAGAVARERTELLMLARPEFFMYLEKHPAVAINLLVLLSRRLRFALQQAEDEADAAAPVVRLARLITRLAERYGKRENGAIRLSIRLTLGELAGLIGRPRSDTEAAFETLRQAGVVDMRGLQMTIHDLEKLRTMDSTEPSGL
jgi:CRP/FNR family cyclic AMP-dependent transcriptional regulator